jgi:hypothetical protein
LWTTISRLNYHDLDNIKEFANTHKIDHGYAYLTHPVELNIDNKNIEQVQAYIQQQKQLRNLI